MAANFWSKQLVIVFDTPETLIQHAVYKSSSQVLDPWVRIISFHTKCSLCQVLECAASEIARAIITCDKKPRIYNMCLIVHVNLK